MKKLFLGLIATVMFCVMGFSQSYGKLHNDAIHDLLNTKTFDDNQTITERKEELINLFVNKYGNENKETIIKSFNFKTPHEAIESVKNKISSNLYNTILQDIDYLTNNSVLDAEPYFENRYKEVKLDEKELDYYVKCSTIYTSSVELWSSEEGVKYIKAITGTTLDTNKKRPRLEQHVA